jgi:alkylhydroperoxidase/carboxymuconolactone decarboxylase family protein
MARPWCALAGNKSLLERSRKTGPAPFVSFASFRQSIAPGNEAALKLRDNPEAQSSLNALIECGLLKPYEADAANRLGSPESPYAEDVELAETLHLHIKTDDTNRLPINRFFDAGARLDHQKEGFVKYRFPGSINAIFSHIKVSQDELLETEETRRPRPFLDHIGIDLRDETDPVRRAFDALPALAESLDWSHASQGGPDRPVYCCHVEVAEKHWLYPPDEQGRPGIPLEFAYGPLKVNPEKMGCDLRPADPSKVDPASIPCCAAASDPCCAAASDGTHVEVGSGGASVYYNPQDLARFGEIARVNPELGKGFFAYYGQAMAEGALTQREKALIALAVAHALKCPYCIDAYTGTLHGLNVSEAEMSEAVHVAAALAAGITMVHSVQMMNKLDQLTGREPVRNGATGDH